MNEFQSLADLLDLQDVDLQIDRLLERRSGLPELEQYREAHEQVEKSRARLADAEARLREVDLDLDKSNSELELAETKVAQQEKRLFAGGMSAKETENMRRDVEMLRTKVRETEDRVLELLELREQIVTEVAGMRDVVGAAESDEQQLSAKIKEIWKGIDAELARREERKAEIVKLIPPDLLELYEDLRRRKDGVAVGRLDEMGICGGCHLKLSAAERRQAIAQSPPRCVHCRRILVP